jgi:ATP-dependent Zn protease
MIFKKFFALLFIISMAIFLYFQFFAPPTMEKIEHNKTTKTEMYQKSHLPSVSIENNFSNDDDFILLSSLITSILSFLGFVLSSYHAMRGNRRDEEIFNLQKERERLQLEKIQAEIQALRGE